MSRNALHRYRKRTAARLRALRSKAAEWRRRARRAMTLALIAAGTAATPSLAMGQTGQMGMAPTGGLVNRAVNAFGALNGTAPGYLYYGVNAADRGLGYNGSYMTVGGFIPYSEDDLGGLWSADLRGHLSEYGGFFSNVGFVRKQFLAGSLLGVGVYWDYDGDMNQYPAMGMMGTQFGQFGHAYNQVGVSGEWLTDFGNLRSNGYIPVGTTAYTAGAPNFPFYQNFVMCQYGLDAALGGADLEVGAYIPGLSDWAGMVSVGGYALGNSSYNWWQGPQTGQAVVPWFGGVYTRLDMTFIENWDFSLQANNDSYFDWTGFARLTYRMGGSRRRNVPDQMEQPMTRNEHIVRGHQTPIMAINPSTGTPWRVVHVNNAAPAGGNGTIERPYDTLAAGDAAATQAWDIVFVSRGDGTATGYGTEFSFNQPNQYLIGDGASFLLPTATCGLKDIATNTSGLLPLLSNPAGNSILIDGSVAGGATAANFQITGSDVGVYATGDLTDPTSGRGSLVQNVSISGNGTSAGQSGVIVKDAAGKIDFVDTRITDMTTVGLEVSGGNPTLNFQGSITNDVATNGGVVSRLINIENTTGAVINIAKGSAPAGSSVPNEISDTGGEGIRIIGNSDATTIDIDNVSLTDNLYAAIALLNDSSTTNVTAGSGTGIVKNTSGAAISIEGGGPTFQWRGPIQNSGPAGGPASYLLNVNGVSNGSVSVYGPGLVDQGNGIQIQGNTNTAVNVDGAKISSVGAQGILINGNTGGEVLRFSNVIIDNASQNGVLITNSDAPVEFSNLTIALTGSNAVGFQAVNAGNITSVDNNSITNGSSTQSAVIIDNTSTISLEFTNVTSGAPADTGSPYAMQFLGTSAGSFTITSSFLVNSGTTKGVVSPPAPAPGDVLNTAAGVTVSVPP